MRGEEKKEKKKRSSRTANDFSAHAYRPACIRRKSQKSEKEENSNCENIRCEKIGGRGKKNQKERVVDGSSSLSLSC